MPLLIVLLLLTDEIGMNAEVDRGLWRCCASCCWWCWWDLASSDARSCNGWRWGLLGLLELFPLALDGVLGRSLCGVAPTVVAVGLISFSIALRLQLLHSRSKAFNSSTGLFGKRLVKTVSCAATSVGPPPAATVPG